MFCYLCTNMQEYVQICSEMGTNMGTIGPNMHFCVCYSAGYTGKLVLSSEERTKETRPSAYILT